LPTFFAGQYFPDNFRRFFKFLKKLSIVGNFLTMIGENCPAKNVGENCLENTVRRKMSSEECLRKFYPAKKFGEISTCADLSVKNEFCANYSVPYALNFVLNIVENTLNVFGCSISFFFAFATGNQGWAMDPQSW
jgi:hypothetical protein